MRKNKQIYNEEVKEKLAQIDWDAYADSLDTLEHPKPSGFIPSSTYQLRNELNKIIDQLKKDFEKAVDESDSKIEQLENRVKQLEEKQEND